MEDQIGAPGSGISRRDFVKASGLGGTVALAGCTAPGEVPTEESVDASTTPAQVRGGPPDHVSPGDRQR